MKARSRFLVVLFLTAVAHPLVFAKEPRHPGGIGNAFAWEIEVTEVTEITNVTEVVEVTEDVKLVAKSNNAFALDLYALLRKQDGNLFFSPASISTALAMTHGGASGKTEQQMTSVLRFSLQEERLHESFSTFNKLLNVERKDCQLSMANRLWGQKGFSFRPEYLALTREVYQAELAALDFVKAPVEAAQTINGWVEEQTNNRIKDLISPHSLNEATRLVLTNAIYFKGDWAEPFKERLTQEEPFRLAGGGEASVPQMRQEESLPYAEAEGLQLVELDYAGGDLSMIVLLPNEVGLANLERKLTVENLTGWLSQLQRQEVRLVLPRFKMTSEFQLKETLSALGMPVAFSDAADFSRMTSADRLFIDEVVHKAFVEVNEKGTEAAAATAVEMRIASADPEPVTVRADRPFLFLIRDYRTGAILFLGRVTDPTQ